MSQPVAGWLASLLDRRVLVMVGSGGVGKTTTSAAVAVEAALSGRRVLVLTIDPAKRLADALGLQAVGNQETEIPLDGLRDDEGEGDGQEGGSLYAMMLDTEAAFDDLVARLASDSRMAKAVRDNRIYRHLVQSLAGAQEYLAGEKIFDATQSGRFDLVVLDTPPTSNALDFLDASKRLVRLFDDRVYRWLLPTEGTARARLFDRLLRAPSNVVKRLLAKVFGERFVVDLEEFFVVIHGIHSEVRHRSEEVQRLLRSRDTAFLLVTSPLATVVDEALYFHKQIRRRGYPFAGFVVNRIHPPVDAATLATEEAELYDLARDALPGDAPAEAVLRSVVAALRNNLMLMDQLAERDRVTVEALRARMGGDTPVRLVPKLPDDVHDLEGLRLLGHHLFGAPTPAG